MPTDYTGTATATQSPDTAPALGKAPLIRLPVDADARNSASIYQPFKDLADNAAFTAREQDPTKSLVRSRYLTIEDDFTGDSLNRGTWINSTVTFPTVTGVSGVVQAIGPNNVTTSPLGIGTADFQYICRARWPNYATTNTMDDNLGLYSIAGAAVCLLFRVRRETVTSHNIMMLVGATETDTGVAVNTSAWKLFSLTRSGTTITFAIDGVTVQTLSSDTTNRDGLQLWHNTSGDATSSQMQIDYAKFSLVR